MIFELQISHIQCYYGYHRILILIFLIVLRLFQSRDYTFFLTIITTVTESDWLCLQPKNSSRKWTEWGLSCKGGGGKGCRHNLRFSLDGSSQMKKWQLAQKEKSPDLGSSACTLIIYNYRLWHKLFFIFFAVTADVYRNEGNEAFILFYTDGIKMESNEKELKAKLYNNRAITHFKLGKMMRTLICIFSFEARGCQL